MILKPIKKNVIVSLIQKSKVSEGGIILKRADPTEVNQARILAIGDGVTLVEVGQKVLPNWNKATKTVHDSKEYYIVPEDEIVLIFEGEDASEDEVDTDEFNNVLQNLPELPGFSGAAGDIFKI
jgi:co-chaperonin GroES (HSP10)